MTIKQIKHLHPIKDQEGNQIGRINLISYLNSTAIPHIEYDLDQEYWGRGIMTEELKNYLAHWKEKGQSKFIALVEKDNLASAKVLEKNDFVKVAQKGDYFTYIINLNFGKKGREILKMLGAKSLERN